MIMEGLALTPMSAPALHTGLDPTAHNVCSKFIIDYLNLLCASYITAVCSPDCENGGTCVGLSMCACAAGWEAPELGCRQGKQWPG